MDAVPQHLSQSHALVIEVECSSGGHHHHHSPPPPQERTQITLHDVDHECVETLHSPPQLGLRSPWLQSQGWSVCHTYCLVVWPRQHLQLCTDFQFQTVLRVMYGQFRKHAHCICTVYWPVTLMDRLHPLGLCYTNRQLLWLSTVSLLQSASLNGGISPVCHFRKQHGHIRSGLECPISPRTA